MARKACLVRRLFSLCLVFILTLALAAPVLAEEVSISEFAGGTGQETDPFLIVTPQHLDNVRNYLGYEHQDKYFRLENNIDLSGWSSGQGWQPIGNTCGPFTGNFIGNGNIIYNLFINRPDEEYVGLFGRLNEAEIQNLGLVNANITGKQFVGALAGNNDFGSVSDTYVDDGRISAIDFFSCVGGLIGTNNGRITDCFVTDSEITGDFVVGGLVGSNWRFPDPSTYITGSAVTGTTTVTGNQAVGGLAGQNIGGTIAFCYSDANVDGSSAVGGLTGFNSGAFDAEDNLLADGTIRASFAIGNVSGEYAVGGLAGSNTSKITDCYATGNVTGNFAGGLVGDNWHDYGEITRCYATGMVTGPEVGIVGGLVGSNFNGGPILNSYYDRETTNQGDDDGKGIPRTTVQMKQLDTFEGWCFETTWSIIEGVAYPYLQWQGPPARDAEAPVWPEKSKLKATYGSDWAQLSWIAAQDNVGVAGYRIYVAGLAEPIDAGNVLQHTVTGLSPGSNCTFIIEAYDADGNTVTGPQITIKTRKAKGS